MPVRFVDGWNVIDVTATPFSWTRPSGQSSTRGSFHTNVGMTASLRDRPPDDDTGQFANRGLEPFEISTYSPLESALGDCMPIERAAALGRYAASYNLCTVADAVLQRDADSMQWLELPFTPAGLTAQWWYYYDEGDRRVVVVGEAGGIAVIDPWDRGDDDRGPASVAYPEPLTTRDLHRVTMNPVFPTTIAVGDGGTVLLSADMGTTWTQVEDVPGDDDLIDVAMLPTGHAVAISASSLWVSEDHGLHWEDEPGSWAGLYDVAEAPTSEEYWSAEDLLDWGFLLTSADGCLRRSRKGARWEVDFCAGQPLLTLAPTRLEEVTVGGLGPWLWFYDEGHEIQALRWRDEEGDTGWVTRP